MQKSIAAGHMTLGLDTGQVLRAVVLWFSPQIGFLWPLKNNSLETSQMKWLYFIQDSYMRGKLASMMIPGRCSYQMLFGHINI